MKDIREQARDFFHEQLGDEEEIIECIYIVLTGDEEKQRLTVGSTEYTANEVRIDMIVEAVGLLND